MGAKHLRKSFLDDLLVTLHKALSHLFYEMGLKALNMSQLEKDFKN